MNNNRHCGGFRLESESAISEEKNPYEDGYRALISEVGSVESLKPDQDSRVIDVDDVNFKKYMDNL